MSNFFKKHFGAIALGTAINLPSLVKGIIWATDWLSRLDFWNTHLRDIPGIAGVAALMRYLIDPPPWTVFLTSIAAILIILWDVRRQSRVAESTAAAPDPFRRLKVGFFIFCAAVLLGVWAMAWPLYFPAAQVVAAPKPIPNPSPLRATEATAERAIYRCKRSASSDQKTEDARLIEFKRYIEAYADTFGYASKVMAVPGGRKAELTPMTVLAQRNMGNALKVTLEVRMIGKDLLGVYTAEYPANVWAGYLLPEGSETEKRIRKRIEDLVGAEPGDCELQ